MPTLCIQPQPDGSVLVGPSEYELDPANAESFPDLKTALVAAGEVLGSLENGTPEQPPAPAAPGGPSPMQAGYTRAKKGL